MTESNQSSARFRSATEFPKTIASQSTAEADNLYKEMRDCLIFTNRSRSQLLRRNEEHKQSALKLKADVQRLQSMISQLKGEKEQVAADSRQIVTALEQEIASMAGYLDQLSTAFDSVADVDNPDKAYWGVLSVPGKFLKFLNAIKAIVLWWRDDNGEEAKALKPKHDSQPYLSGTVADDDEELDKPQMHSDQASQGRSLLDK
ncbi:conserved hypothetical protein (plasmid) [Trichormus variabilis ATCC 29413]|uniref:Uncharacterized protein n=2 Tax=Anabaena variabilis TaxID=264691 RepID=Q3M1X8_TRIV2|nr:MULTISPECIES: hypothetical protein [Nostocaceae]ABA25008.1 conserved hypothetical protein [Trichormus variabilis ATCC 29413]MBC1217766.1 hypothetical protein [Trichormus variabilis ARAD]MBC1259350.1 hypothetical protein [Trichormus variabilis V5]MBC1270705.1 hypothetical protein [Trichormus variabilis FSR]MBC1305554.1 hypothetical protein [Trichormus variabilis N2B]